MSRILLKNAECIVTFDSQNREIANGWLVVDGNRIESVGSGSPPSSFSGRVIDCEGMVVVPGLVNTHHHLYQSLYRCVPGAQDKKLFEWLSYLYPRWKMIDEEAVYVSTIVGCLELLLSGCTTTTDHLYLFPKGKRNLIDVEIEAAQQVGIRFHSCRGSMCLSQKEGGLPPDDVVQSPDEILKDSERLLAKYHDVSPGAMIRVALAPCSPFSVTPDLMKETAALAREHKALLHTHLAETLDELEFCRDRYGCTPIELLERTGWLDEDVWLAHAVHVNDLEIKTLSSAGVGVSHCPSSNAITGAGIAPIRDMMRTKMRVGLGVDGSAANDMGNLLREAREAMLLSRLRFGADAMSARDALRLATIGGASVLHQDKDIGSLEPGKCADIAIYDVSGLQFAGAHDIVSALLRCDLNRADFVLVNGEVLVENGKYISNSLEQFISRHKEIARRLVQLDPV